ncbi:MAG: hypothetical protein JOY89_22365 [Solirubrobacterales bacterium]|nr:hypothetical protein [Solirubrobacterales bacterium]
MPLHPPFRWKRTPKPAVRRRRASSPVHRERTGQLPVGLARRIASFAAALPDHSWLDRVVRGRAWIPLLGVLLAGIVTAQVEILKLGASMGRALEQTTTLTAQNEQLRGSVAQLADGQRIERLAGAMGLVLPPPGAVGYLAARPGDDVSGALGNIHAPDAAGFVAMSPRNGALVTGQGTSTLPPTPGAPAPSSSGTTSSTGSISGTPSTSATTTIATTATTMATTAAPSAAGVPSTSSSIGAAPSQSPSSSSAPPAPPSAASTSQAPAAAPAPTGPATGAAAITPSGTAQQSGGG